VTSDPEGLLKQCTAPAGEPAPRSLLVFAHPDDETIALGARIHRYAEGLLVHVTDGAPRNGLDSAAHGFSSVDDYRAARFGELDQALLAGGAAHLPRQCLAVPDQEASLELVELSNVLACTIGEATPEAIFTHAYEGGHPDHDACAFAVHQAVSLLVGPKPLIVECALYHAGPFGMEIGTFLPHVATLSQIDYNLTPEEQERKRAMIAAYTSQRQTLAQFRLDTERFRIAPRYDFTRPPHAAPVHYDRYSWGTTSARFCELACAALSALDNERESACR
jgi:LmbE family N-acetylglucosaminyl deacetylase